MSTSIVALTIPRVHCLARTLFSKDLLVWKSAFTIFVYVLTYKQIVYRCELEWILNIQCVNKSDIRENASIWWSVYLVQIFLWAAGFRLWVYTIYVHEFLNIHIFRNSLWHICKNLRTLFRETFSFSTIAAQSLSSEDGIFSRLT